MAPSVPKKKRKVNLPENEEVAARIFEKHRSMAAQQPGGLPDHQARALSTAYSGVCSAKEPIRTPGDLARLKGVGGWVVDVMEDSFPGSSLDLSPPRSNTPGETGKKNTRSKPYVPRLKSAAYAIMITLYRYYLTEKGKETAHDCLTRSGLDGPAGPLTAAGHPAVVLSDSDSDEYDGSSPLTGSERSGLPNSKAGSSSSFGISMLSLHII